MSNRVTLCKGGPKHQEVAEGSEDKREHGGDDK